MTFRKIVVPALASLALLAACSSENGEGNEIDAVQTDAPLATVLAGNDDFSTVSMALNSSGMAQIFDGVAYYTVLAPTNEAFAAFAPEGADLSSEEQRPALIAILRDHILPGYLTLEDIGKAIDNADGSVTIQTMGEHALTFTREGDSIRVSNEDGANAMLLPGENLAGNGVLLPIDGVLREL